MCDWIPHQDLILDAIEQLRRRKARPDAERIYNCLYRKKGLGSSESRIALDRCVDNGVVLRVSYKGNISYRNAAKKKRKRFGVVDLTTSNVAAVTTSNTHSRLDGKPRRKFTNLLTNTFAELVLQEPDYLELGVPEAHLIKTILEKDSVRYTKKYLWILLQKEVENGGLVRLENGNFLVGKPQSLIRKQNGTGNQNGDKEQLNKIKKEMRNHHVMHRKPAFDVKVEKGYDKGKKNGKEVDDDGNDSRDSTSASASGESDRSRAQALSDVEVVVRPTRGRPPGRGRFKTRGALSRTGRGGGANLGKRDRQTMEDVKNALNENLRVGGRRKKAKKVFDPSESNMPKRRGRPPGSTKNNAFKKLNNLDGDSRPESRTSQNGRSEGGVCSVCHIQNKKGPAEMISCRECSNKAHASCLNGDDMMLKMYPDNTWQCPHCKTCVVCYETSDAGTLVVCSICADAYHTSCHSPRITEKIKPSTKWLCNNCKMADQLAVDNIQIGYNVEHKTEPNEETPENTALSPDLSRNSSPRYVSSPSSPTLPTLSPQTNHNGHNGHSRHGSSDSDCKSESHSLKELEDIDENIDPSIPDASNWSPDEVMQYFAEYFPEEARVFKEQEIDGHSLLVMRRMDVVRGLQLKLGPALKIYRHVLKLQYRRDDRKLCWA